MAVLYRLLIIFCMLLLQIAICPLSYIFVFVKGECFLRQCYVLYYLTIQCQNCYVQICLCTLCIICIKVVCILPVCVRFLYHLWRIFCLCIPHQQPFEFYLPTHFLHSYLVIIHWGIFYEFLSNFP